MDIKRIKIMFYINRPHLTYDILTVFKKHDIPIISMEVYSNVIYLKIPFISDDLTEEIRVECEKVYGYDYMEEIDVMSFEEKDIGLKSVLNLISEGVIILDSKGVIEYGNKVSFDFIENVRTGHLIFDFIDDKDLKNCIKSDKKSSVDFIRNKTIQIKNKNFLLNMNPLYSEEGIFCGYLLTLKEIKEDLFYDSVITFDDIMGDDRKFRKIIETAKHYSHSDASILLTGESGTGKEMFARAIHSESKRSKMPFVSINCASIPDELLESELFGYTAGSFTGANKSGKIGIFEMAEGGTVFLDEIGELNYHLQAKLLRVLQEKKIRPIGSAKEKDMNVRIISATNRNLEKLINEGSFRMDLFYRLNIFRIQLPPLRQRQDDIPKLTNYFLKILSTRYDKQNISLSNDAESTLISYSWPGNIREMQNVLERAVVLTSNNTIKKEHIIFDKTNGFENISIEENYFGTTVSKFERELILKYLRKYKSIRNTAKNIGVTHTLLINRIKKYHIEDDEWKNS